MADQDKDEDQQNPASQPQNLGLVSQIGPVAIDWPRSLGYFGGVAAAVALGLIEPPVALFIAAVPLVQMFNRPGVPSPVRFAAQVYEGASTPVGGGVQATTIQMERPGHKPSILRAGRRLRIFAEARELADKVEAKRQAKAIAQPATSV